MHDLSGSFHSRIMPNRALLSEIFSPLDPTDHKDHDDIGEVMAWLNADFTTSQLIEPSPRIRTAIKNTSQFQDFVIDKYLQLVREVCSNTLPVYFSFANYSIEEMILHTKEIKHFYSYYIKYLNFSTSIQQSFNRSINSLLRFALSSQQHDKQLSSLIFNYLYESDSSINLFIDYISILQQIGLGDELNAKMVQLTVDLLKSFIHRDCATVWDQPFLQKIGHWIERQIYPKLSLLLQGDNKNGNTELVTNLRIVAYSELVSLRIKEIFDIVVDFPQSSVALFELRNCIKTPTQRAFLVDSFVSECNTRLLHAGANTIDIISCYTSSIHAFLIIDPRGVLLDKASRPIRRYLKERDDIIPKIVNGLMDTSADNDLIELATELRKPPQNLNVDVDDLKDLNWVPDPVDALPDFKKGKTGDIIESLISIFDSRDIFVGEFIQVFSNQLIGLSNYDVDEIVYKMGLLKSRFGEEEFTPLEVMVKDVLDSQKTDSEINGSISSVFHSTILSHLYWPSLPSDEFQLPKAMQQSFDRYASRFSGLKRGRNLKLLPNLGSVSLDLEFGDHTSSFNVSPDKASVICLFESSQELTVDEISSKVGMAGYLVSRICNFWVKEGILQEIIKNCFKLIETERDDWTSSNNQLGMDFIEEEVNARTSTSSLKHCWPFIIGMLTNLGSVPLSQIHSFLGMLVPKETPYLASEKQLEAFLSVCIEEEKLEIVDGKYRLKK